MKRMRTAILIFCVMLVAVSFNYIYVRSVRTDMLQQLDAICDSPRPTSLPDSFTQMWKNRKGLLSLSVPLTVLDQIDIQLSVAAACTRSDDADGYLSACHHLRELVNSLGG